MKNLKAVLFLLGALLTLVLVTVPAFWFGLEEWFVGPTVALIILALVAVTALLSWAIPFWENDDIWFYYLLGSVMAVFPIIFSYQSSGEDPGTALSLGIVISIAWGACVALAIVACGLTAFVLKPVDQEEGPG